MSFDVILSNGLIVNGTGGKAEPGSVAIVGDRIAAVGNLTGAVARTVIDCHERVISPGFIDIHTHYDPQILWDSELTPSSWYGVTSVIMGNCGFTIAPMRPQSHRTCIETLGNVEAMSVEALEKGISWDFETFAEYLHAIEARKPTLNVGAFVGHTALRLYVLGTDASRTATQDEIVQMCSHLEAAMASGAWGFSTSRSPSHVGTAGRPVASRGASVDEVMTLSGVLSSSGGGVIQGVGGPGFGVPEFAAVARHSKRPVTWCSLHEGVEGGRHWELSHATAQARREGADLWAQMGCLPIVAQFTLDRPYILESVAAFGQIAGRPREERLAALSSKAWRDEAERQIGANLEKRSFEIRWDRMTVAESSANPQLIGRSLQDIAGSNGSPLEALVELSKADQLQTRFKLVLFNSNEADVAGLLGQDSTILGLSDAGAHASQLCDASFALHLLGRFVRERQDFPLEYGVWRLTGHPAAVFGLKDRGVLRQGAFADICVFDRHTVGEGPSRRVYDLPAGADRLVKDPIGMEHVMVNGQLIRRSGRNITGVGSGRLLKPS